MKFNFNIKVSKMLDYLKFPRIYLYSEEQKEDDALLSFITKDVYRAFIDDMIIKLKPFGESIKKFYSNDIFSNYDYVGMLLHAFPVYDFEDINQYFESLTSIDDKTFGNRIIKTLFTIGGSNSKQDIVVNEQNAMEYINNLKIDSANKWHMLMIIQNPKLYLFELIDLLKKVENYFDLYFYQNIDQVQSVGQKLVENLQLNPNQTFSEMTYNLVAFDFTEYEKCYIYVSALFPYTLNFLDHDQSRFIWGMEMSYAFERLHAYNDDKTTQRVKVFKALGDKTRYEALKLLAKGVTSVKDIASELDVSSATISYHLNEFLTSGIISLNKDQKKKTAYVIDYKCLEEVIMNLRKDLNFPE
jgi:DNA-binding transcriptional ArsR family regulator